MQLNIADFAGKKSQRVFTSQKNVFEGQFDRLCNTNLAFCLIVDIKG
jgi:glutaredoxin 2